MSLYQSALHLRDQVKREMAMLNPCNPNYMEMLALLRALNPIISRLKIKHELRQIKSYGTTLIQKDVTVGDCVPKEMQKQKAITRKQKEGKNFNEVQISINA